MNYLRNIWLVLTNKAFVVPIDQERDSLLAVISTEGGTVDYCRIVACIEDSPTNHKPYIADLSKILYWVFKKNRYYWHSDKLGQDILDKSKELASKSKVIALDDAL